MKRLLSIVAVAGLTAAANAQWTWLGFVESGLGGDAGVFGQHVAVSGERVVVSDGTNGAFAFDALTGTRYALPMAPWARGVAVTGNTAFVAGNASLQRFNRSGTPPNWNIGTSYSLSASGWDAAADGNLVAVTYDVTSTSGKIKVYEKISGSWTLSTNFGHLNDTFGWSVAIDDLADVALIGPPPTVVTRNGRMIVGSPAESITGVTAAGVATIYEQSGSTGTWSQAAELTDPSPTANDLFGMDVAISGSYAFVADHDAADGPGQVHIYKRSSGGVWSWSSTLALAIGRYGESIAAYGDRLLIGVPNNTTTGYAIMYQRSGSTYAYEAPTLARAGMDKDCGSSVALTSNVAVVGGDQSGGAGRVHIFTRP